MRHILRKALEELTGVKVIGEAGNGLEAIRLVKETAPQVVFLDIAMPEKDGLEAAREICDASPMRNYGEIMGTPRKPTIIFKPALSCFLVTPFR